MNDMYTVSATWRRRFHRSRSKTATAFSHNEAMRLVMLYKAEGAHMVSMIGPL